MSQLTVPTRMEPNLVLGDGSAGPSLSTALEFSQDEVANLYSTRGDEFSFSLDERGVAYREEEVSSRRAEAKLHLRVGSPGFSLRFDPTPVEKWGINFAGTVLVAHDSTGDVRVVYLPGTRTYDPAGITGAPACMLAKGRLFFCLLDPALINVWSALPTHQCLPPSLPPSLPPPLPPSLPQLQGILMRVSGLGQPARGLKWASLWASSQLLSRELSWDKLTSCKKT